MNGVEAELAIERLLDKHEKWLILQPEVLLLWTQDRNTRKRVAQLLAKQMTTIPVRDMDENTPPNRAMRRAILDALAHDNPEYWQGVEGWLK